MKIFEKNALSKAETMELSEIRWTTYGVLLVHPFPVEKLQKFVWI